MAWIALLAAALVVAWGVPALLLGPRWTEDDDLDPDPGTNLDIPRP